MGVSGFFTGRVSIVCVGNELNGDDAFGYHLYSRLQDVVDENLQVVYASTVPENFVGEILSFRPGRVVVVDAGDFGGRVGEVRVLDLDSLEGFHVSTHRMPLRLFARWFEREGVGVTFVSVQVAQTGVGESLSPEVADAVERLCGEIVSARNL
jgi:hydrogenase 3 maturation protease